MRGVTPIKGTSPVFAPNSFWYTPIPNDAPTHPNSANLVAFFEADRQAYYYGDVNINTTSYAAPVYIANSSTPRQSVGFVDNQRKGYREDGLLQRFTSVPIEPGAQFAGGTDKEMVIYSPSTDEMWEFWVGEYYYPARPAGTYSDIEYYANHYAGASTHNYYTTWGGYMANVSQNVSGSFDPPYGTTATGLPFLGGQISITEAQALYIPHAIGLAVVNARAGGQSWPARRNDGNSSNPNAAFEGQRFYLPKSLDVNALSMHPLGKAVARAIQQYGLVIWDKAGAYSLRGENPLPYTNSGQIDPWTAIFNGTPSYAITHGMPWSQLIALPFDYGKP